MPPILLPLAERAGRFSLRRRGAESRWVSTDYGPVHCYDLPGQGTLPTVVLLHGLATAATAFAPLAARLGRDVRRVVAPDHLGHGFSAGRASAVEPQALLRSCSQTLTELVDEPAIVVGNSMGGALALKYALAHPERVSGLVLVSPAGAQWVGQEWEQLRRAFDLRTRAQATAFFERLYHRTPWFLSLLAHELPASMARESVRSLLNASPLSTTVTELELASLKIPVLLLWGQSDRLLPRTHFDYFARHLPTHAQIEQPYSFGHSPHLDSPDALASRIVDFAATT